ncbi:MULTISPECIES: hypothetical protein [Leptolyngbya]|jgi:hypothetical protein|uniref:Uncharacterized protein n=1 Tax=Leptolyngbya boryana CZ1 TaxID=3060204 RepID=A0AA96WUK4_LEPBY|nr:MULTISPECIES: hypothetical protein [Leptolyngbya]MBD1854637.1 hypothetical protein [Leptolyngbya sp. FACHB-1624]MBD2370000.1 hypothetical protein [Leptolyngbya sp. FACHB-161]MBD2376298.1 hypothetical protein [Leptolyngbya sp. FACHB-238]MBD2400573.1 hypothetical protein [Leptolyngbya sp. FACHB-239]MBD2407115.1 hypothetical protein [Leptolyngbya sp. FACHB-402]
MSSSNSNGHPASIAITSDDEQISGVTTSPASREALIPNNLSSNKRAIIERLIELHQHNANRR